MAAVLQDEERPLLCIAADQVKDYIDLLSQHLLRASAFRKHSGQMKRVFSELSAEELQGLEVALKKIGKRAAALTRANLA